MNAAARMFATMLIIPTLSTALPILFVLLAAVLMIKHATLAVISVKINAPKQNRNTDAMALAVAVVFGNGLIPPHAILTAALVEVAMAARRTAVRNVRLVVIVRTNV
jgi:hypothetical protein